jgi:ribosomal-protein-alanine N-acetyltransferase
MEAATPWHAAALAAIHAAAFDESARWSADAMRLQLAAPNSFGWVDAAGGMVLARVAWDEAEILTLAVAPASRRRGLGRLLLGQAMGTAASRGAASMVLEVAVGNGPALGLYAAAGFVTVGRRRRYYADGTDALILRAGLGGDNLTFS